ncbi:unnamed protein product [Adineta ricciae]|uniref:Uncharacterized protein n=1 Tax=Adineta ricciae TaxID=249248 RepID=A0A815LA64_ADIRI|nr:unnamed protein product [Adineta ricciae]
MILDQSISDSKADVPQCLQDWRHCHQEWFACGLGRLQSIHNNGTAYFLEHMTFKDINHRKSRCTPERLHITRTNGLLYQMMQQRFTKNHENLISYCSKQFIP